MMQYVLYMKEPVAQKSKIYTTYAALVLQFK